MDKNTLYFIDKKCITYEVNSEFKKTHYDKYTKILEDDCLKRYTTLAGRIKAISKIYNYQYNVPIYVDSDMLFFKIGDIEDIWVNIMNVHKIMASGDDTIIYFKDASSLVINKYYRNVYQNYSRADKVIKNKNGLF